MKGLDDSLVDDELVGQVEGRDKIYRGFDIISVVRTARMLGISEPRRSARAPSY